MKVSFSPAPPSHDDGYQRTSDLVLQVEPDAAQIRRLLDRDGAVIWAPFQAVLANTSACFKDVVRRRREVGDDPLLLARIYRHVDRAFGIIYWPGVERQIFFSLDIWF